MENIDKTSLSKGEVEGEQNEEDSDDDHFGLSKKCKQIWSYFYLN